MPNKALSPDTAVQTFIRRFNKLEMGHGKLTGEIHSKLKKDYGEKQVLKPNNEI